ncbi:MAG: hypothetical protein NTX52_01340 [Planctomycetota bacterium]|nr:hypothetical protein [Planctomycetota bacterium]
MDQQKPIRWIPALIFNALLIPVIIAMDIAGATIRPATVIVIFLITLPITVVAIVLSCIVHYKCWKAVPKEIARTTPGKAVGFLFIPFFNFYWAFVSYMGLAEDLNKAKGGKNYRGLGIALAIFFILSWTITWIPLVTTLIEIPSFILWVIYTKDIVRQAMREDITQQTN